MLRTEIKEILILAAFSFLLREYLTPATLLFVVIAIILIWNKIILSKLIRNGLSLLIFASYWFTYGKVIDPEIGLNFLVTIIVIKLLEKESKRDQYMIFYGLILVISAGSLFEKSLIFVAFFFVSFFILIRDFYQVIHQDFGIKNMLKLLFWVLPLTVFLFFFIPRVMNPFSLQKGNLSPGEIGYTPNVSISDMEEVLPNERPAFQVLLSHQVRQQDLYWRGNTLSLSDGWNWFLLPFEASSLSKETLLVEQSQGATLVEQEFRLYGQEDFFFTLDSPVEIKWREKNLKLYGQKSLPQEKWNWVSRYQAISSVTTKYLVQEDLKRYKKSALKKNEREWAQNQFKGSTFLELEEEIKNYFRKNGFVYSLKPGQVKNFTEFMQFKKTGLCSHYASATALILRAKGIPTRLVSGYMGGDYNQYAQFYLITQNDAHVWVEAYDEGSWHRIDPTDWIMPDRVLMGGEAFVQNLSPSPLGLRFLKGRLPFVGDIMKWVEQWNFKFYQWMESMDYYSQSAWFLRLSLKGNWPQIISFVVILLFIFSYYLHLKKKKETSEVDGIYFLWDLFFYKLKQRKINIPLHSISQIERELVIIDHKDKETILDVWRDLVDLSYAQVDFKLVLKVKRKIQKL